MSRTISGSRLSVQPSKQTRRANRRIVHGKPTAEKNGGPAEGVADPSAAETTATLAGIYTLTVTSVGNGCADTDTMEVFADQVEPVADAGPDVVLDCSAESVELEGAVTGTWILVAMVLLRSQKNYE